MQTRRRIPVLGLWIAVAALVLGACANDDETVVAPQAEDITTAGFALPSLETMTTAVQASTSQTQLLGAAHARWKDAGTRDDGAVQLPPSMSFLSEASAFLDHQQMLALVQLMETQREEYRAAGQGQHQPRGRGRGEARGPRGQRGQGPGAGGHPSVLDLADELGLNAEQIAQIEELQSEHQAQMQALRQDAPRGQRPSQELRDKVEALRDEMRAAVEAILTEEQLAKLEELRAAQREEHRTDRDAQREMRQSQRFEFLVTVLQLSEEQATQAREIFEAKQAEADELRASFREQWQSAAERPTDEVRQAQHEAVQAIMESGRDAVRELLDDEQQELFDALLAMRPERGAGGPRGGGGPGGHGPRG